MVLWRGLEKNWCDPLCVCRLKIESDITLKALPQILYFKGVNELNSLRGTNSTPLSKMNGSWFYNQFPMQMKQKGSEIKPTESWLECIKGEPEGGIPKVLSLHSLFDFRCFLLLSLHSQRSTIKLNPGLYFSFFSGGMFLPEAERDCVCSQLSWGRPGFDVGRAVPTCPVPLCQEITAPSLRSPTGCWEKRCPFDVLKTDLQRSPSSPLFCLWFIQTFSQVRSDSVPQFQNKQRKR